MDAKVSQFQCGAASLVLSTDQDWCTLYLKQGGQRHELGAELEDLIVGRLLNVLESSGLDDSIGQIDGIEVTCILLLAERHGAVYAALEGEQLHLFFQDSNGKTVARTTLSSIEQRRLAAELKQFLAK